MQSFFAAQLKEGEKEKKGNKKEKRLGRGKSWASLEDGFFLMLMAQNWLCVNAAAAELQKRTETMERWHQEVQVKES